MDKHFQGHYLRRLRGNLCYLCRGYGRCWQSCAKIRWFNWTYQAARRGRSAAAGQGFAFVEDLATAGRPRILPGSSIPGDAIFVMDGSGRIFVSYEQTHRFHHSSFLSGGPVAAAGHMSVIDGKIININDRSGHYMPEINLSEQIKTELSSRGIDISTIRFDWKYGR